MVITSIIAEYNPFHNGHLYQIKKARELGATHIVCIMSGNFTQRGEPAIIPKHRRVLAALECGADLVLELPTIWAMSSAENFAKGSVWILSNLGCIDTLVFGSENGDISILKTIAKMIDSDEFITQLKLNLIKGMSFPKARYEALNTLCGNDISSCIINPNDILAVEYIRALNRFSSTISPQCIIRKGSGHDSQNPDGIFASASYIRSLIKNDPLKVQSFMPNKAFQILYECIKTGEISDINLIERAIMASLRKMTAKQIACIPDVSEGLENRIISALKHSQTINELYDNIKSKRYTHSRIRRICMSAFLQINAAMSKNLPPYIRILGTNNIGRELLAIAGKKHTLPIIGRYSEIISLDKFSQDVYNKECMASDLYGLATNKILPCGMEQTRKVINI